MRIFAFLQRMIKKTAMAASTSGNGMFVWSAVIFALNAIVAGQGPSIDQSTVNNPVQQQMPNAINENFYKGSQNFSLNFFKQVSLTVDNDRNVTTTNIFVSPLSVWTLLALLSEGAEGETLREILEVMSVQDQNLIKHHFKSFQETINVKANGVEISSAQFMFTDKNHPVRHDFEHIVDTYYGENLFEALDFSSSNESLRDSYNYINKVVSDATKGQIKRAIHPTNLDQARLLLLSVLFFQGEWTFPFNRSHTNESTPFYDENERIVASVPMMFQKAILPFAAFRELEAQIVELPYGSDRFMSMLVILPRKGVPLHEVVQRLANFNMEMIYKELRQVAEEYEDDEVEVFLPRFQISSDYVLKSVLFNMGMREAFHTGLAQFNKIASDIVVNDIFQKNKIVVNEEGTTASSVSGAVFVNKATPPRFIANRPFAFLIVDKRNDLILFMGQVKDPRTL
ncbi:serine protease inhibitor 77Ba-like isoform X2 [Aedes aegypti]|uniref:Putative serine proteinase inhibitor n=1 Tax=Aedes aegypti TaxID=7159 RepID=A0A0N8ERZ9_AEDAE|nr:serine protease inhibitor 77Ba isoform X2 [Aedes aegypti]XP_021712721.1 serine protease inhibitor 77Ba-like isoform X2 [Aedes aegypti]